MLYVTQASAGLLAGAFAVLTGTHERRLWTVRAGPRARLRQRLRQPGAADFISELVPPDDLPNAVTLNSVSMNIARVFGAAFGGVVAAAFGLVLCFGLNAVSSAPCSPRWP